MRISAARVRVTTRLALPSVQPTQTRDVAGYAEGRVRIRTVQKETVAANTLRICDTESSAAVCEPQGLSRGTEILSLLLRSKPIRWRRDSLRP